MPDWIAGKIELPQMKSVSEKLWKEKRVLLKNICDRCEWEIFYW